MNLTRHCSAISLWAPAAEALALTAVDYAKP